MIKTKVILLSTMLAFAMGAAPAIASEQHNHGAGGAMTFPSASAGLKTIDELIAEAKAKIAKGDFEGLHESSEEFQSASKGLNSRLSDIPQANAERFKFNVEQIRSLGAQLEEAHESKNKAEADTVIKRLEGVRDRLKSLTVPS